MIWEETRKKFGKAPEQLFADKNICITGRVFGAGANPNKKLIFWGLDSKPKKWFYLSARRAGSDVIYVVI